ncbi:MAG TPA: type II toxin-antitoxin system HicB family antitoxin, partial [Longimicrobium sp.]
YWSAADDAFIAAVPELEGCMAHGPTRESALANAQGAIAAWLATAKEFGDPIPEPRQRTVLAA